jgi:hypothetical protein
VSTIDEYLHEVETARTNLALLPERERLRSDASLEETVMQLSEGARTIRGRRFSVTFCQRGSSVGAVLILRNVGSSITLRPGDVVEGEWTDAELKVDSTNGASSGQVTLKWGLSPGVVYREPSNAGDGALPNTGTAAAAYNVTTNTPAAVTDGVSLLGANGARVVVQAPAGQTIAGGTVRIWGYSSAAGDWALTPVEIDLPLGVRTAELPDFTVGVGYDRFFPEVRSATHSGGAGAFNWFGSAGP